MYAFPFEGTCHWDVNFIDQTDVYSSGLSKGLLGRSLMYEKKTSLPQMRPADTAPYPSGLYTGSLENVYRESFEIILITSRPF
jgi:hypothetical protein